MGGKKGVALSLSTLGVAFLTIAVVTVIVMIFNANAGDLAEGPLEELLKLIPIGEPRILSFKVEQVYQNSDEFKMSFELAGNLRGLDEVVVEKKHRKYHSGSYDTISPSTPRGPPPIDLDGLKDNDWKYEQPAGGYEVVEPGYTVYTLIVTNDGGKEDDDSVEIRAYDENYLEMHDSEAGFCSPAEIVTLLRPQKYVRYDNKQCNVIECKRNDLILEDNWATFVSNEGLPPIPQHYYGSYACSDAAMEIIEKVADEFRYGGPRINANNCGAYSFTQSVPGDTGIVTRKVRLLTDGCSNAQIDELSKRMVRVNLMRDVCEVSLTKSPSSGFPVITSEEDYGLLSYDEFTSAVESAVGKTQACVHEYTHTFTDQYVTTSAYIKGAKKYFDGSGGGFIQIGEEFGERERAVREELSRVLPPNIGDLKVESVNGKLAVTFYYINSDKIQSGSIRVCRSLHAIDPEFVTTPQGLNVIGTGTDCTTHTFSPGQNVGKANIELNSFTYEPGLYDVSITIKPENPLHPEITRRAKGGIYNSEYLEKYGGVQAYTNKEDKSGDYGWITVCVEDPKKEGILDNDECDNGKGDRNLAECNEDCDVIGKKLNVLKTNAPSNKQDWWPPDKEENGHLVRRLLLEKWNQDHENSECRFEWFKDDRGPSPTNPLGRDKHYYILKNCKPEEVDELYNLLLNKAYDGLYDCTDVRNSIAQPHLTIRSDECEKGLRDIKKISTDDIKKVNEAKIKLRNKLIALNWVE